MSTDYLQTVHDVYAAAALKTDATLCCTAGARLSFPDLRIPKTMLEMNYGCGSSVHPADLGGTRPILYVGVGGGMEALELAYFRRRPGGVIAVDPVREMREAARRNLDEAARENPWFRPEFVEILEGDAHHLPVPSGSVDVLAQNCLFNVFVEDDFLAALRETHRVLAPGGRFSTSDPITTRPLPEALRRNQTLRARCTAGCQTYEAYLGALAEAGFRRILIRSRVPYRLLTPHEHPELDEPVLLESIEVVAVKDAPDACAPGERCGLEVHSGRTAIYVGTGRSEAVHGLSFAHGTPVPVSDAVAQELGRRNDFHVTASTFSARELGCC